MSEFSLSVADNAAALTNFQKFEILIVLGVGATILGSIIFIIYELNDFWRHPAESIGHFIGIITTGVIEGAGEAVKGFVESIFGWGKKKVEDKDKGYKVGQTSK